jgi:hypothetical protein
MPAAAQRQRRGPQPASALPLSLPRLARRSALFPRGGVLCTAAQRLPRRLPLLLRRQEHTCIPRLSFMHHEASAAARRACGVLEPSQPAATSTPPFLLYCAASGSMSHTPARRGVSEVSFGSKDLDAGAENHRPCLADCRLHARSSVAPPLSTPLARDQEQRNKRTARAGTATGPASRAGNNAADPSGACYEAYSWRSET